MPRALLLPPLALLAACSASNPPAPVQDLTNNPCNEPRPQVCTMEYNPVCADLVAGGQREYASPCNACADDAVSGFLEGACPEPG